MKKKKILIFIPAYNVEKKIINVIKRIPKYIFNNYNIRILIIEDHSGDNTLKIIRNFIRNKPNKIKIYLIINKRNYGYGGVQKIAFSYAIENNFEYIVMLHGDGQYSPKKIHNLIKPLITNKYDAVFGSRMMRSFDALKGGMPIYKYFANKILTFFQNLVLSTTISEFHSGYRAYRVFSLKKVKFKTNTNHFHFDTEIIIQFLKRKFTIKEIPIPTFYGDEVSHLKSVPYGLNIILSTILFKFKK